MTTNLTSNDIDIVGAGFDAVAAGDIPRFASMFRPDATWNHRNPDRLGGVKTGIDEILAFLGESVQSTAGTLRVVAENVMTDGAGHVAAIATVSGTRPDGRQFHDTQVLYFTLQDGLVVSVDQYIGDPDAVTAFWA